MPHTSSLEGFCGGHHLFPNHQCDPSLETGSYRDEEKFHLQVSLDVPIQCEPVQILPTSILCSLCSLVSTNQRQTLHIFWTAQSPSEVSFTQKCSKHELWVKEIWVTVLHLFSLKESTIASSSSCDPPDFAWPDRSWTQKQVLPARNSLFQNLTFADCRFTKDELHPGNNAQKIIYIISKNTKWKFFAWFCLQCQASVWTSGTNGNLALTVTNRPPKAISVHIEFMWTKRLRSPLFLYEYQQKNLARFFACPPKTQNSEVQLANATRNLHFLQNDSSNSRHCLQGKSVSGATCLNHRHCKCGVGPSLQHFWLSCSWKATQTPLSSSLHFVGEGWDTSATPIFTQPSPLREPTVIKILHKKDNFSLFCHFWIAFSDNTSEQKKWCTRLSFFKVLTSNQPRHMHLFRLCKNLSTDFRLWHGQKLQEITSFQIPIRHESTSTNAQRMSKNVAGDVSPVRSSFPALTLQCNSNSNQTADNCVESTFAQTRSKIERVALCWQKGLTERSELFGGYLTNLQVKFDNVSWKFWKNRWILLSMRCFAPAADPGNSERFSGMDGPACGILEQTRTQKVASWIQSILLPKFIPIQGSLILVLLVSLHFSHSVEKVQSLESSTRSKILSWQCSVNKALLNNKEELKEDAKRNRQHTDLHAVMTQVWKNRQVPDQGSRFSLSFCEKVLWWTDTAITVWNW